MEPATNQTSTTAASTGAGVTPPAGAEGGTNGQQAATTSPAAGAQSKTFTQEDVNRLVGQAREEGRQAALKKATETTEQKLNGQQTNGTQQAQQQAQAQVPDVGSLVEQAIAKALQSAGVDPFTIAARQAGYTPAQVELARAAHSSAKPEDTSKWLSEWPAQVGMQIKAPNGGAGVLPHATASTGGPPRKVDDMRDEHGLVDVFALSPEQVLSMGPTRIREEFEKVTNRARELSGAPPIPSFLRQKK